MSYNIYIEIVGQIIKSYTHQKNFRDRSRPETCEEVLGTVYQLPVDRRVIDGIRLHTKYSVSIL